MLSRFRPSPAMVVACVALIVALGGSAYAVTSLPKDSVGSKQLKKNAVTSPKVKDNTLTGADINESNLGPVPTATNALRLGGADAGSYALRADLSPYALRADLSPYVQHAELQPEPVHLIGTKTASCATDTGRFCDHTSSPCPNCYFANHPAPGLAPVGYRKDSGGWVHLQGVTQYQNNSTPDPGAAIEIFYLPPGYRPTDGTHEFSVVKCANAAPEYVDIQTDGAVVSTGRCMALDGVVFHP